MNPISHARPSLLNPRFGHRFMCLALCVLVAGGLNLMGSGWAVADTGSVQLTDGVIPTVAKPVVHLLKLRTVDTEGGMIDPGLTAYVERVVEEADSAGIDALVFDIDTFGGRVDAATIIRDAILDADLLTIAFI
ncbi:MAG: hypothetical protein VX528_09445, partial [Candidatus Latescibacterota bacterium]|nr:hypothetical protein [Candidatus Latescibacterota bacterium]